MKANKNSKIPRILNSTQMKYKRYRQEYLWQQVIATVANIANAPSPIKTPKKI